MTRPTGAAREPRREAAGRVSPAATSVLENRYRRLSRPASPWAFVTAHSANWRDVLKLFPCQGPLGGLRPTLNPSQNTT